VTDLISEEVARAISVSAYGGFLVAQQAARLMAARESRAILLDRCFGQREGLSQFFRIRDGQVHAPRLGAKHGSGIVPKGVHVAHFVIDGGIRSAPAGPER